MNNDVRLTSISELEAANNALKDNLLTVQSSLNSLKNITEATKVVESGLLTNINNLSGTLSTLKSDLVSNPVPASQVVVPEAPPKLIITPMTAAFWSDTYGSASSGQVSYDASKLTFAPKAVTRPDQTSAVMMLHKQTQVTPVKDFRAVFAATTLKQTRLGSTPNGWEVFWFVFNYVIGSDGFKTANYITFAVKSLDTGTMWGKLGQAFLLNNMPGVAVGAQFTADVTKVGQKLTVLVNGKQVLANTFVGGNASGAVEGHPEYMIKKLFDQPGAFGLYCEDAQCSVSDFQYTPL